MNETLFYVLGIALVVVALGLSALGLREEKFPASRGLLAAIAVAVAALVVATASFAWLNAEDEQEHKAAELAAEREANLAEGNVAEAGEEGANLSGEEQTTTAEETTTEEQTTTTEETTTTTPALDGAQVFTDAGCAACHTLAAAGSSATTGPDLDAALKGESPEFIETSIVDPNAQIAQGFPPDVMPQTFGDQLTPEELAALVEYLSTNAGKG